MNFYPPDRREKLQEVSAILFGHFADRQLRYLDDKGNECVSNYEIKLLEHPHPAGLISIKVVLHEGQEKSYVIHILSDPQRVIDHFNKIEEEYQALAYKVKSKQLTRPHFGQLADPNLEQDLTESLSKQKIRVKVCNSFGITTLLLSHPQAEVIQALAKRTEKEQEVLVEENVLAIEIDKDQDPWEAAFWFLNYLIQSPTLEKAVFYLVRPPLFSVLWVASKSRYYLMLLSLTLTAFYLAIYALTGQFYLPELIFSLLPAVTAYVFELRFKQFT